MSHAMQEHISEIQNIQIPDRLSNTDVITWLDTKDIDWKYMLLFKQNTALKDEVISDWLNISVKTLRNYRKPANKIKDNVKEQLLLLLSLFAHGKEIFGTNDDFNAWLNQENFYFDGKAPVSYLNTIAGIRFVESRLIAMEYGDNV
ncbi:antitoxin Xre/MbcA/ParS toxin-binding domain-containing protein [Saccharicrinis sp. FJH2]|uniref:antitoxin Xre/MbcA/ParS toxin-binding domain-containing protein n=1 Tax=Saccharicrinis sp. FJH65 TaxID=3344659 RepID=UPI0035F3EBC3